MPELVTYAVQLETIYMNIEKWWLTFDKIGKISGENNLFSNCYVGAMHEMKCRDVL